MSEASTDSLSDSSSESEEEEKEKESSRGPTPATNQTDNSEDDDEETIEKMADNLGDQKLESSTGIKRPGSRNSPVNEAKRLKVDITNRSNTPTEKKQLITVEAVKKNLRRPISTKKLLRKFKKSNPDKDLDLILSSLNEVLKSLKAKNQVNIAVVGDEVTWSLKTD